ncbi:MAG: hypothetical protein AAGG01_15385, partial [Planctomycetota bacterium]
GAIELVSVGRQGLGSANEQAKNISCSADGEVIAFDSEASSLVLGDMNDRNDVFVRDMRTEVTVRVSLTSTGAETSGGSNSPRLSRDGRFVVFNSLACLSPDDAFFGDDVYRYDLQTGDLDLLSIAADGSASNSFSVEGSITDDGQIAGRQPLWAAPFAELAGLRQAPRYWGARPRHGAPRRHALVDAGAGAALHPHDL